MEIMWDVCEMLLWMFFVIKKIVVLMFFILKWFKYVDVVKN